jgi:hypothetical protein
LPPGHIRIVTLLRGTGSEANDCKVRAVALDQNPSFIALSYVWGSKLSSKDILLNKRSFKVTVNLFGVLDQLRKVDHDSDLWIDAIAINQSDVSQRNHQVQHITRVFMNASEVYVCIGNKKLQSWFLLDSFNKTYERPQLLVPQALDIMTESLVKTTFRELNTLALEEYWYRIWVVQEVAVCINPILMYGPYQISYQQFSELYQTLAHFPVRRLDITKWKRPLDVGDIEAIQRIMQLGGPFMVPKPRLGPDIQIPIFDVQEWLRQSSRKFCSDPRDYVYGFYSRFSYQVQMLIPVDYAMGLHKVYEYAAEAFIHHTNSPKVACCSRAYPRPSWIPNFQEMSWDNYFSLIHTSNRFPNIAGSQSPLARINRTRQGSILVARGVQIGLVTRHMPVDRSVHFHR